ncbi:hypothetical protein DNK06_19590 [Pseudomonas daroniae]|uniref:Uncharacterized protein n=1 Tax=Phytopseudomonas daroniae TaxID=2487519 RepID=A0A4Q9QHJ1_9GAMM|nr:hypothetical protein DNK06_19590 [Pseudomonas daroniae]TBU85446.1 hypothetical protein DNK31_03665 [Pseudomonas sp. FRB 228]TBU94294.1 hypothetical protein DNJ99_03665 [Pseudomonas daroniae]
MAPISPPWARANVVALQLQAFIDSHLNDTAPQMNTFQVPGQAAPLVDAAGLRADLLEELEQYQ